MADRTSTPGRRSRTATAKAAVIATLAIATACGDAGNDVPPALPSRVVFAPASMVLDNPATPGARTQPTTVTIDVTAHDARGEPVTPSSAQPLIAAPRLLRVSPPPRAQPILRDVPARRRPEGDVPRDARGRVAPAGDGGDALSRRQQGLALRLRARKTLIEILAGPSQEPTMSYSFEAEPEPVGPAPLYVEWIDGPQTFVNVGRRPLFDFHYPFDARCGRIGFAPAD